MTRILALILAVLVGVPAYADSPIIWFGQYAKSLTSKGLALQSGALINNDGALNYAPQKANKWTAESNVTVADDTTAADLARANTTGTGVKFTATGAGDAYFCFTLDTADYNKKLAVQWDQNATAGVASTYVAGDYQLDVYSSTSSTCASGTTRLALSTDSSALSPIPALSGTYRTTFDSPGSAAQYVKVQITRVNNSHSLVISNLYVGPGTVTQGAAVSEWQSYTPTVANFTGTVTGKWRRVGDSMQVRIYAASTTTVAGTLTIPVPTGYTIDSSKVAFSGGSYGVLGVAQAVDLGNAFYYGSVAYSTTTAVGILNIATGGGAQVDVWKASVPFTWGNTDTLSADFTVPIAEWAGSGTVNIAQNSPLYYATSGTWDADSSTTIYGTTGQAIGGALTTIRTKTVTVTGTPSATDIVRVEIDPAGTGQWQEALGSENVTSSVGIAPLTYTTTGTGGNSVGLAMMRTGASTYQVQFGHYYNASLDGTSVLAAWSDWSTASGRWRLAWYPGGQAVGFSNVTQTGAGLVQSAGQLLGTNTNDSAIAGNVGETVQTTNSAVSLSNGGQTTVVTLSIPSAGDWDVSGCLNYDGTSITENGTTAYLSSISATTNSITGNRGYPDGSNQIRLEFFPTALTTTTAHFFVTFPSYQVKTSGALTLYLVANPNFTAGSMTGAGFLTARRRR